MCVNDLISDSVFSGAEDCGRSKYADAGEHCPIDGTCTPPAAGINVVGGMPARENEFPYQVSGYCIMFTMLFRNTDPNQKILSFHIAIPEY